MFQRIRQLISLLLSVFVDGIEDSVPLERRLAHDRGERALKLKSMMGSATDIGAFAEQMIRSLAEARIVYGNLRDEIAGHVKAAKAAAGRGDSTTEKSEMGMAAALADDLAEAQGEVLELEAMVNDALADKDEARQLVLEQALQLERLAQKDSRLVAKVRMTDMREQSLALKEQMLELIPGDTSSLRQRAVDQATNRSDKVKARGELVTALWNQRKRGATDRVSQTTEAGAEILAQISQEVGYTPATADQQVVEEIEQPTAASRRAKAK